MMKSSFRRRELPIPPAARLPAALAIAAIAIVGLLRLLMPETFLALATPLWGVGASATDGASSATASFADAASLTKELRAAQAESARLAAENRALLTQISELGVLRDASFAEPAPAIVAGVLARPPVSPYDVLIVAAGHDDGVREGALATGPGDAPLGSVASVGAHTSRVLLYSSPGVETDGWIGETRLAATLIGAGAGALRARVPSGTDIAVGETVYAPGPRALGTVVSVSRDPSSTEAAIRIRPFINPFSMTSVLILAAP